jgi:hypothetical protein
MKSATRVYLPVVGGLLLGLLIGGVVFETSPAILGWIFGAGSGLMGGAFIAALVTNEPIVSGRGGGVRHATFPGEQLGQPARGEDDGPD